MVTGDHIITAAAFAKGASLIKSEKECISFHELADCDDKFLIEAADKYRVFSSATSYDRERLVRVLSENNKRVIVAGQQMTAPSVALYANASFGDETMPDCDVMVKKCDIENVSETIYKSRSVRGNLAYSSLLAISIGLAEVLVMLYMLLTGQTVLPTAIQMLLVNLFVVFVPTLAVSVCASVHHRLDREDIFAVRCVLQGVICALFSLASGQFLPFVAVYAILEAARICVSFDNLEKGRWGIWGLIALTVAFIVTWVMTGVSASAFICALAAVVINSLIPYLKLKGLKK
ncbi:MAG: cation-transporting P-type ATPase [Clostridia bacterium]|nr:cation-transporting P-type ATPase [Clostridia bacterium]